MIILSDCSLIRLALAAGNYISNPHHQHDAMCSTDVQKVSTDHTDKAPCGWLVETWWGGGKRLV